ncbi:MULTISPECIES: hypothetical protein [unclassified Bradyrhizobium]|uniref:hypothetical protein n=1 Tax=unclassified Bradyrhizobium TaxID=2631580 RepID=UPI00041AA8A6|nr:MULTISPECIES: hypothetical protein [unclassified Bradyrhizobium]MCP3466570.1 hypothetical protein [Bradyrhizobium sp. CCGUVB23]
MNRELREFRRLERVCLEQAELSTLDLARIGLLKVAADCRVAAEAIEAKSPARPTAGFIAALKQTLSPVRSFRRH